MKSIQYLKDGFTLANNNLSLFVIGFLLSLLFYHSEIMTYPGSEALSFVFVFIYIGYHLSIPLFLSIKQAKKKLPFSDILKTSFINLKRSLMQIILLTLLFMGIIIFVYMMMSFISNGNCDFLAFIQQGTNQLFAVLFYGLLSLFIFTSIYFSIEKVGFFRSTIKSIKYSFQHVSFIVIVGILYIISYVLSAYIYDSISKPINIVLQSGLFDYMELVLVSSAYYCYLEGKKGRKKK